MESPSNNYFHLVIQSRKTLEHDKSLTKNTVDKFFNRDSHFDSSQSEITNLRSKETLIHFWFNLFQIAQWYNMVTILQIFNGSTASKTEENAIMIKIQFGDSDSE